LRKNAVAAPTGTEGGVSLPDAISASYEWVVEVAAPSVIIWRLATEGSFALSNSTVSAKDASNISARAPQ
jgi:hypothetical protein